VFVYSASFYSAKITYGDEMFFLKKQLFGVAVGFIGFFAFSFFDYKKFHKLKYVLLIISFVLLGLVFVPHVGFSNYGATRWINLGFITFQPSEIAKIAFIIFSASLLSKSSEKVKSFKGILPILIVGGIYCLLIIMEPNMSITICMALLLVVMLFIGGARFKHFLILSLPAAMSVVLLILIEPYRLKRLVAFIDPFKSSKGEGFQLVQSLLGIALGGMFGVGVFKSRQKYLFLPFSESDFILSIIAEETGFVGAIFLLGLFIVLFLIILKVAKNAADKFGFLLSVGIGSIIIIQVLLNLAVVTGLVPPTGLPLPFISAGSTSIMIFMSMLGVVQNVHRQSVTKF
jgi:cell division protein FtsW